MNRARPHSPLRPRRDRASARLGLLVALALGAGVIVLAAILGGERVERAESKPRAGAAVEIDMTELPVPAVEDVLAIAPPAPASAEAVVAAAFGELPDQAKTTARPRAESEDETGDQNQKIEAEITPPSPPISSPVMKETPVVKTAADLEDAIAAAEAVTVGDAVTAEEAAALAALAPAAGAPAPGPGAKASSIAAIALDPRAPWRAYAAKAEAAEERPMIALVIDDLGHNPADVERAIALGPAVTLAFLPYTADVERSVWLARRAEREILLHLPMEPHGEDADPGPHALLSAMAEDELLRELYWNLARFDQYVGLNNHMGSKATQDPRVMEAVLETAKERGLLFLDSVTTANSAAAPIAARLGVPFARRDVFIDNDLDAGSIERQLAALEETARREGSAIGIAHPHPEALAAIEAWLPGLAGKGFVLVPVSAVVMKNAAASNALASEASATDG